MSDAKHQHAASLRAFCPPVFFLFLFCWICLTLGPAHRTVPEGARQEAGWPPRSRRPLPVEWVDNGGVRSSGQPAVGLSVA